MLHRRRLVELVRAAKRDGVTISHLLRRLGDEAPARERVVDLLEEAEARGELVARGRGRYVAIEYTDLWVGTVRVTRRGFGILSGVEEAQDAIVIPPEHLGSALDGDRVLVERRRRRRRGNALPDRHGAVVRVLERRRRTLAGRYRADRRRPWVDPFARRLNFPVFLESFEGEPPRDGEFVEVAIDEVPMSGPVAGRLVRRLGAAGESGVDEEVVLTELGIPVEFPPDALREAAELVTEPDADDIASRVDHRDQPAVTIDGETAKDFDDAVVALPAADGAIEVFVHIADVAHYVVPGSALDRAARQRGTSVYLPGRAVPMLPEKLSNNLCSLLPDEDRLVFTVRFLVTGNGAVEGHRAERSVFRSRRRCTYDEVYRWIDGGEWPADLPAGVRASLDLLDEAAARLRRRREERGAIDFDLPEPEILLDPDGFMTGVQAVARTRAHRLIEELMITANECVARMLRLARRPALFRIHERPSPAKLTELQAVLEEFDVGLRGDLEELPPSELQRVLAAIEGRPEHRFLQTLVLRSLARAAYDPQCKGHYALATDFYLHFTSPIRRYPDLVVHRSLASLVAGERIGGAEGALVEADLADLAPHCSFTERRAEEAEREVVRWKQAEYMRERVGEEFTGHVTGVVAFGLFVQLDQVYVEGLIHVSSLGDDYYRYDEAGHRLVGERKGRSFRLADAVTVRVAGVDEETMEVDLELISGGSGPAPQAPADTARSARGRGEERPTADRSRGRAPRKGRGRPRRAPRKRR